MSAADLATIREALEKGRRDDELLSGRDFKPRYWNRAFAALARVEADRLTAREARHLLVVTGIRTALGLEPCRISQHSPVVAKLERIAGDTGDTPE